MNRVKQVRNHHRETAARRLGKFMAKRRHFSRTQRGLGGHSPSPADEIAPEEIFNAPAFDVESLGDPPWNSVRSEKVRRARQLVQDGDYPPPEVLQSVAGLLAQHLSVER